jgi:hypothetical protein
MQKLKQQDGFALLITIVLVSFLVLILVAMSTLTRVETTVSSNSQDIAKARQNAMMALNIAVGQLQRHAGPDRRISATLGHKTTSTGSTDYRYLTGIWNENEGAKTPLVWLINSSELLNQPADPDDALNAIKSPNTSSSDAVSDSANWVYLLWKNSADPSDPDTWICLNKETVQVDSSIVPGMGSGSTPTIGHYAYWVGDEGVKASIALSADTSISFNNEDSGGGTPNQGDDWSLATNNHKKDRLWQFSLNRTRLDQSGVFGSSFDIFDGQLPNILRKNQLLFISSGAPTSDELKEKFHAITPMSYSVLADLSNTTTYGRLKVDLSDVTQNPIGAINYQQARVTESTTGYVPAYEYGSTGLHDTYETSAVLVAFGIQFWYTYVDPTITLNYRVTAALWNPYATKLIDPASNLELRLTTSSFPTTAEVTLQDASDPPVNTTVTVNLGAVLASPLVLPISGTTGDWEPGQVKEFAGGGTLTLGGTGAGTATAGTSAGSSSINKIEIKSGVTSPITVEIYQGATSVLKQKYEATGVAYTSAPNIPISGGPDFGYGFRINPDLRYLTGAADGIAPVADIRSRDADGDVLVGGANLFGYPAGWAADMSGTGSWNTVSTLGNIVHPGAGTPAAVLFDLPRQEITSIGMLTHMYIPTARPYALGNRWGGATNSYYDKYFVSTVPRFAGTGNNADDWNPESGKPLLNRYIKIYHPDDTSIIPISSATNTNDILNSEGAAQYLLQTGSFNINSVSQAAWEAVLGSRFDGDWDHQGKAPTSPAIPLTNTFFRLPHGAQTLTNPPLGTATYPLDDDNSVNTGGRQLTNPEVIDLASAIVAAIESRAASNGPFRTLQEFINEGIIAGAIDSAGINSGLSAGYRGTPAALSQADVINAIVPFMSARSDTFLIRAYGDVENPITSTATNPVIEGRAWCEAVVQRVPDMVDPSLDRWDPNPTPTSTSPYFGRKFKIISFRWLTTDDL